MNPKHSMTTSYVQHCMLLSLTDWTWELPHPQQPPTNLTTLTPPQAVSANGSQQTVTGTAIQAIKVVFRLIEHNLQFWA